MDRTQTNSYRVQIVKTWYIIGSDTVQRGSRQSKLGPETVQTGSRQSPNQVQTESRRDLGLGILFRLGPDIVQTESR